MRYENSVTSISWIPSEAAAGSLRAAFGAGLTHRGAAVETMPGGACLAGYRPGALLGERTHLEGGARTSTLVTVTPCRTASVDASQLDRSAPMELPGGHRREDVGRS